ncbi:MAG: hypothetical protein PWQ60_2186, partial [Thermoanaerobacteraceae bacterium]|nr:hypothetical protein [Thermoanaerobacteraceae bacterium]
MKKLLVLLIISTVLISLAGCGGGQNSGK